MLLYTGCRISELLDLKKEHVNLKEHYFNIVHAKTAAGIRVVPIADKVLPFFEYWYTLNDCEYLLSTPDGLHFTYRNYYDSYWSPLVEVLNINHTPHCTTQVQAHEGTSSCMGEAGSVPLLSSAI